MMNKRLMVVIAILALFTLPLLAQRGGGRGNGNGNGPGRGGGNGGGTCPLLEGTPFTFDGTVSSVGTGRSGMVVTTAGGELTVTGLGPFHYWESQGVERPVVGDTAGGKGYTVDYNGTVRNVLTEVTVHGATVALRDEDGKTLWKGRRRGRGPGRGNGPRGNYNNILAGTPFNFQGEVITAYVPGSGIQGRGLEISTANGNVKLHGMGPVFYWEDLGVQRPVVGDNLTANGYAVDFSGNNVNVLMSVTLANGTTVQLRDAETGAPLWRGTRGNRQ